MDNQAYQAVYGKEYYDNYNPPYVHDSPTWTGHFGRAADQVVANLFPRTVIDAGCAIGVLVQQLRLRSVDARGVDVSEEAISRCAPDVAEYLQQHNLVDPIPGEPADVVICIEVLEHLPEEDALTAIGNLCRASLRYVIFSSTSNDTETESHINVQQQPYWDNLFEQSGFQRTDISARNFCGWAVVYERVRPIEEDTPAKVETPVESVVETKEFPALQAVEPGGEYAPEVLTEAEAAKPPTRTKKKKATNG